MIELGLSGLVAAFAAGVVSFLSPCVLPLVPGYLSFVSGVGIDELGTRGGRVTLAAAGFVAGFGAVFVAFGAGAALFGAPCIGPTLAAILTHSAGREPASGAVLLGVFALGLGAPFLLFGLAFTRALGLVRALRRRWRAVSVASGALLIVFGVLLASGQLLRLTGFLARYTDLQL